jgi:hypothetical protein
VNITGTTDENILTTHGWSDLGKEAYYTAVRYFESAPSSLKASWAAQYLVLYSQTTEEALTIADIDRHRKDLGYVGYKGLIRFEEEVLTPQMHQAEAALRVERAHVDSVVDDLLHGVPSFGNGI